MFSSTASIFHAHQLPVATSATLRVTVRIVSVVAGHWDSRSRQVVTRVFGSPCVQICFGEIRIIFVRQNEVRALRCFSFILDLDFEFLPLPCHTWQRHISFCRLSRIRRAFIQGHTLNSSALLNQTPGSCVSFKTEIVCVTSPITFFCSRSNFKAIFECWQIVVLASRKRLRPHWQAWPPKSRQRPRSTTVLGPCQAHRPPRVSQHCLIFFL